MTHMEVINKLAGEMTRITGEIEHIDTYRWFIRQALDIGITHFTQNSEEVIAMTKAGVEVGRFKSVLDAEKKLGVRECNIHQVLSGSNHTAGGYIFIRSKDWHLIPRQTDPEELNENQFK